MGVLSGFLVVAGLFLIFMVCIDYDEYDSDKDKVMYGKMIGIGFLIILAGAILYPGETEAEKLYKENRIMKEELQEKESKMKRWKYIQHLREENKKLKDSLR